ncbi:IS66 family transposase [Pseudooceanicola spongiae]|uniref:IS66 family transposase n=1 Tax=Pseudooceanicola spongiae TaxID=2613965 RepID=UPI00299F902A|nr:transposase [Pseudooceanicola spongiae]
MTCRIVAFTYAPGWAGQNAEQILQGSDGILQLDDYADYNRLTRPSRTGGAPITLAQCWAHARRKLTEVFNHDGVVPEARLRHDDHR